MRLTFLTLPLLLAACGSDPVSDNHQTPPISVISETPGDWSALDTLVGRTPADSALIENSPISVDLAARLGPDHAAFRAAMMRAGPLVREGPELVTKSDDAWLVLQPADHAFRAALRRNGRWQEWTTAAAEVPAPR